MATRNIEVRLAAKVDSYVAAMRAASASTLGFSRSTERNLRVVGGQLQTVGRRMTTFVTAPLALMGAAAIKSAVDWESAWAGVTKTVDGTAVQMAELEQGLRDMSKELPATHQEIAAVAEAAGALGVATPDVLDFTRVMIDLGETTNLTADQAATSIAQLMNVMQTAPGDVDNLGSALVHLGNNGASTEDQIIQMAQRIAGAGELIGLSEADVLGFANALASMGIEVEAGGSSLSRVFADIGKAVAQGGDDLAAFSEVAGLSASQFATAFREDPAQAIVSFIDGLGRIHAAGGDVFTVLDQLGMSDIRVSRALLSMATSGDLLTDSLRMSEQAWTDNTALADEAAKRYETAAARFEMVRNQIVDLFIDLGEMILPFVEAAVGAIGALAEMFQSLPAPVQAAVGGFLGLVAAMGPMVFIAGSLIRNLTSINTLLHISAGAAGMAGRAMGLLGLAVTAGIVGYQIFTAEQRQTAENTRASTAALDTQFTSLLNAAVAAARAAEQIDAVALANEALSLAIAEGNTQLAESASQLNISGDQLIDVLSLMDADGEELITTLDFLARSFGLSAEQADFFARNFGALVSPVARLQENARALGADLGITGEQFNALTASTISFLDAADESEVDAIARAFLDARVSAFGLEESLVGLATANVGLANRAEDPIAVYREWVRLMAEADPATRATAGVTDEVAAAIAAAGGAAGDASVSMEDFADSGVSASDAMAGVSAALDANFIRRLGELSGIRGPREGWETVLGLAQLRDFGTAMHMIIDPQMAFVESQDAIWEAALTAAEGLDEESLSLDASSEAGLRNRGVVIDWVKDILAGADAQLAMGDSVREVTNTVDHNIEALKRHLASLGLNEAEIEELLLDLGLMEGDWTAVVKLQGEQLAMRKIEELLLDMETLDEGVVAEVLMIAETEGAFAALRFLEDHIAGMRPTVRVRVSVPVVRVSVSADGRSVQVGKTHTAVIARHGAYTGQGSGAIPAVLHSDEAVLPLSSPTDMARILGLPEVGPRVAAAMSAWMPMHGWGGGGTSGPSLSVDTINVGSRDDLPAVRNEVEALYWRLRVGAG